MSHSLYGNHGRTGSDHLSSAVVTEYDYGYGESYPPLARTSSDGCSQLPPSSSHKVVASAAGSRGGGGRMARRASTGGAFSSATLGVGVDIVPTATTSALRRGSGGCGANGSPPDKATTAAARNGTGSTAEPSFMQAIRYGTLNKAAMEEKINKSLALVNDYKDQDDKIEQLRERFSGNSKKAVKQKPKRMTRRSSLSSYQSEVSYASESHQPPPSPSPSLSQGKSASVHGLPSTPGLDNNNNNMDPNLGMSCATLQAGNNANANNGTNSSSPNTRQAKAVQEQQQQMQQYQQHQQQQQAQQQQAHTDQIVESLVWFSFHTPRTVLEDLISHELLLWKESKSKKMTALEKALASGKRKAAKKKKKEDHDKASLASADWKLSYSIRKQSDHEEDEEDDNGEGKSDEEDDDDDTKGGESTLSSLSDDGERTTGGGPDVFHGDFSESMMRMQGAANKSKMIKLPKFVKRESALLFVDMSGFTKLSTLLDVESLSKVINSYFDMIVSEVLQHGGDILKFAGDAFFAEWRVLDDPNDNYNSKKNNNIHRTSNGGAGIPAKGCNALADLNASLASFNHDIHGGDRISKLSTCVLSAARCATAIVRNYSDYQVTSASNANEAMLNVHCGVGVGNLVGLHVGDYKEDQEEDGVELRREFLILGSPIDQVAKAADIATDGEVMASPEAMKSLAFCCEVTAEQLALTEPFLLASRDKSFIDLYPQNAAAKGMDGSQFLSAALQPYESLRMHCKSLNHMALARLRLQMALYVHPVVRGDELALSAAIQAGKISQPAEAVESRHRAEAELRSVFTIFIKAVMSPKITGIQEIDCDLFKRLCDIMHVTSRELDRYSGHLRQFIVDDKGVVLIATFGLRGSTFPSMISNNGLPAVFAIHRALKGELKVENRIGATFGKVYCGVVGGVRRHEFAVMGAAVNLSARLMSSKVNRGILVDEAVRDQADPARYAFNTLPPVVAKGYDKPVQIHEPYLSTAGNKQRKSRVPLVGRTIEKETVINIAKEVLDNPLNSQSTMVYLMGESGMGKSALAISVIEDIKKIFTVDENYSDKTIVSARSTSTETEQRIPLSSYRKVFMSVVHDLCEHDGSLEQPEEAEEGKSATSEKKSTSGLSRKKSMRTRHSEKGQAFGRPSLQRSSDNLDLLSSFEDESDIHTQASHVTQSLRDISEELASKAGGRSLLRHSDSAKRNSETTKKYLAHSAGTGASTHQRGELARRNTENLSGNAPLPIGSGHSRASESNILKSSHTRRSEPGTSKSFSGKGESLGQSLNRLSNRSGSTSKSPNAVRAQSMKGRKSLGVRDDSSATSFDASTVFTRKMTASVPYFEKLCWVCERLDYPYEYADIVGSQFLGLDGASPVTHVDGHVPTMDELVEFLALAFICIADYADLTIVFLDDFQWVDSFSWKIFRVLCKRGKKLLFMCATRSHDKQALRRLSTAASSQNQLQSQMVEISLGPLDFGEIRQLTARVLGFSETAVSESICADIFQRTGGLPVYVVQVAENMKRKKQVELDPYGVLQWTAEGLKEKRAMASSKGAVMEETFLARFDSLDVRVRKVLQTCAVLGLSFSLSDVVRVHPEMEEVDIENAIEISIDEMILVEHAEEDDESVSMKSGSTGGGTGENGLSDSYTFANGTTAHSGRSSEVAKGISDRSFQFSHTMWRQSVLTTMLKERKIELHRLIAEAMEKDQVLILEQSDISRLLTLFDHWKSCGDFCKTAPLALAVGSRLEEWDLCAQSLELYEDALEMSFDSVQTVEGDGDTNEWVQVSAKPAVLDYILRLHIRIGLCHQSLGDELESITMFEDAYNIIKSSSKIPGLSKSLMMPIISSLCILKLDQVAHDRQTKLEQAKLAEKFVKEAIESGNPVHLGRALSMEASYFARVGDLDRAFEDIQKLSSMYNVEEHSFDMLAEYGRDFAMECYCESVQWLYLQERHEEAEKQADMVIEKYLPLLDPVDADVAMYAVMPLIQVLKLIERARDADWLLKKYVIKPHEENQGVAEYWEPLFTPLLMLLELIIMEEDEECDQDVLDRMEEWVLDEGNRDFNEDIERAAHTIVGELCWRLTNSKDDDDPSRDELVDLAKELLEPVGRYPHNEVFLKHTACALLEAL